MLSADERREIEAEIGAHESPRAAALASLKIVQKHRGWVDDEALYDVAAAVSMSADELDGLATFYSLIFRRPVGKHVILFCDSIVCWMLGADNLLRHLLDSLGVSVGGTSDDGQFTVLPAPCIGCCEVAPAMMVDDEVCGNLTREKIDGILARYRQA
jgi:NADH-quinone oxidoreductase subunit E